MTGRLATTGPSRKTFAFLLLLALSGSMAGSALSEEPVAAPASPGIQDLVEQGRQALVAEKPAESLALLREALSRPEFESAGPRLQFYTLLWLSFAAADVNDYLGAHEYVVVATRFPLADEAAWLRRARLAAVIDDWEDAGLALTTVAKSWPKALQSGRSLEELIGTTSRRLGKQSTLRPQRLDLLNALFTAGYKSRYDREPSFYWLVLATDALERGDVARARVVAKRITSSSALISMRIDRRFDALTTRDPALFDVRAAAEREARHLQEVMRKNPRSLDPVVAYGYVQYTLGRFQEMLSLSGEIIQKVENAPAEDPPYEDLGEFLNWIHNHKASALRALGRGDEAAEVLARWQKSEHNHEDSVSQAINLGFFFNELGRPDDALKALEGIDWSRAMSDYGRTQLQFVRFQAYRQLGQHAEAEQVVNWMRQHQADAQETAQHTLLEAGDADGAATLLISRLRDVDERVAALAEIQIYQQIPRTGRQKELDAQREVLLARKDVAAAITQYGRREKFPVYALEY